MLNSKSINRTEKFKKGVYFKYKDELMGRVTCVRLGKNPITEKDSIVVYYKSLNYPYSNYFYREGSYYKKSKIITKEEAFLEML